jgi:thiosulfate dehydrogenase (quinone) large subunit
MARQTIPLESPIFSAGVHAHADRTLVSTWRAKAIALLRVAFGLIWAIAAWLKWQPQFLNSFTEKVSASGEGQPPLIQAWISFWSHLISAHAHLFATILASTETASAVFLICGFLTNLTCMVSLLLSLGIWAVGEGFGGPYKLGESTDVGTALVYALLSAVLLAIAAGRYYSIDQWLTPRLGPLGILAAGARWHGYTWDPYE